MQTIFNSLSSLSHQGAGLILNGLWLGIILTALMALLLHRIKNTNATTRFALWWIMMAVVIAVTLIMTGSLESLNVEPATKSLPAGFTLPLAAEGTGIPGATNTLYLEQENVKTAPIRSDAALGSDHTLHTTPTADLPALVRLIPLILGTLWAATVAILLTRLLRVLITVRRLVHKSTPVGEERLVSLAGPAWWPRKVLRVQVRLSEKIGRPMVTVAGFARAAILLPPTLHAKLTETECETIILHEQAHVNRGDLLTRPIQKILTAFFFFHPAVRWIDRQLDLECEIACDDAVVSRTGPALYARCLTRLAELIDTSDPMPVLGMATGRKQIFRRFEAILRPGGTRRTHLSTRLMAGALGLIGFSIAIILTIAPVVAVPFDAITLVDFKGDAPVPEQIPALVEVAGNPERLLDWSLEHNNLSLSFTLRAEEGDEDLYTLWALRNEDVHVATRSDVLFSLDGHNVCRISPDGFLALIDRRRATVRELDLRPGPEGSIFFAYFVDGQPRPLDDNGLEWMQEMMRFAVGSIDDGAAGRAGEIAARDGFAGLAEEIPNLYRESVKRTYFNELIAAESLSHREVDEALKLIDREFTRDELRAVLLLESIPHIRREMEALPIFFQTLWRTDDCFEQGRVLTALAEGREVPQSLVLEVLHQAIDLKSDREKDRLLGRLSDSCMDNEKLWEGCLTLAESMEDRSYRKNALTNLEMQQMINNRSH